MFYNKSNGKYAVAVVSKSDLARLYKEGVAVLAKKATDGDINAQACLQRLINSNYVQEGNY
ncbi:hypothetical protein MM5_048 [Morganella phage vB_Mm5]